MTLKWTIWTSLHSMIFKFNGLQIRSRATSSCRHRHPPLALCHLYYLPHTHIITCRKPPGSSFTEVMVVSGEGWKRVFDDVGGLHVSKNKNKMNEWGKKWVRRGKEGELVEVQRSDAAGGFDRHLLRGLLWSDRGLGDSVRLSREGKELGNPAWLAQAWVYFLVVVLDFFPKLLVLRQRNPQKVKCWRITEAVKVSTWLVALRSLLLLVTCTWPLLIGPNNAVQPQL